MNEPIKQVLLAVNYVDFGWITKSLSFIFCKWECTPLRTPERVTQMCLLTNYGQACEIMLIPFILYAFPIQHTALALNHLIQ